jgi:predicted flap endonuclease-1-like 5' DNA nuclease
MEQERPAKTEPALSVRADCRGLAELRPSAGQTNAVQAKHAAENGKRPMHPSKVDRRRLDQLTDLPNVGPAMASDLRLLGYSRPNQLVHACPYDMYERLIKTLGVRQDPCVLDVFISITKFLDGDAPRAWWYYTPERKRRCKTRQS